MSITPPMSPLTPSNSASASPSRPATGTLQNHDNFNENDREMGPLVGRCFRCRGNTRNELDGLHKELSSIEGGSVYGHFPKLINDLCGFTFDPSTAILDHMEQLFTLAKQMISTIQLSAEMYEQLQNGEMYRQSIATFLEYVNVCVKRKLTNLNVASLVDHLHQLVLYLGSMVELSHDVILHSHNQNADNLFHLHLDIYWGVLKILHSLEIAYKDVHVQRVICRSHDPDVGESSVFNQMVNFVVWELVVIATHKFDRVTDRHKESPFPCVCVSELWTLVSHLVNYHAANIAGQTFWSVVHDVVHQMTSTYEPDMDNLDTTIFTLPPPQLHIKQTVDLCFWLIQHLSHLTHHGSHNDTTIFTLPPPQLHIKQTVDLCFWLMQHLSHLTHSGFDNGHSVLKLLLRLAFSPGNVDESQLRSRLRHTLHTTSKWPPNTDILPTLWDYFYKKLIRNTHCLQNQNFSVAAFGIKGLQSVSMGVYSFMGECERRCGSSLEGSELDSSFGLFLRLLGSTLTRAMKGESGFEWRQLKGRFYSKFHPRKMHELTETGLHNFTSLFITLALSADLRDVAGKLLDFYDMLPSNTMDVGRRTVMWKGLFCLVTVHDAQHKDVTFVTEQLAESFNDACREYCQTTGGIEQRKVWELIAFYMNSLKELSEHATCLGVLHSLIGVGFETLLPALSVVHLGSVLSVIDVIITKLRLCVTKETSPAAKASLKALSDTLWTHVYPYMTTVARTQTPSPHISDITSMFCLISLKLQPPTVKGRAETFLTVFQFFCLRDDVNVQLTCRFLGNVLHILQPHLTSELPNYQRELIRTWYRCCLVIPPNNTDILALNRAMLRLSDVCDMLRLAGCDQSPNNTIASFTKAIGLMYRQTDSLMNKIQFRDQVSLYFTDMTKCAMGALRTSPSTEMVSSMYSLVGRVVKHCAPILYVKSKPDCELPQILDCLILPHSLFNPNKPTLPSLLTALKDNSHLIIQGLADLPYTKDPYISRRLKDFISVLVNHFPFKSGSNHPLKVCFTKVDGDMKDHLLQVLSDLMVSVKATAFQQSTQIQGLIAELITMDSTPAHIREKYRLILLQAGDARLKQ